MTVRGCKCQTTRMQVGKEFEQRMKSMMTCSQVEVEVEVGVSEVDFGL